MQISSYWASLEFLTVRKHGVILIVLLEEREKPLPLATYQVLTLIALYTSYRKIEIIETEKENASMKRLHLWPKNPILLFSLLHFFIIIIILSFRSQKGLRWTLGVEGAKAGEKVKIWGGS